jgi:hypothetical protein
LSDLLGQDRHGRQDVHCLSGAGSRSSMSGTVSLSSSR